MTNTSDPYEILMERLGFPGSARLRLIMEDLMTPDQAQMAVELPGTPEEVADKTLIDVSRVKENLEDLFYKGVVIPRGDFLQRNFYRFPNSIAQFHDATMASQLRDVKADHHFYELWYDFVMNEMYIHSARQWEAQDKPRIRVIPAFNSIKDLPGVLPTENYIEILKAQERIAVVPCSCRYCTTSAGKPCNTHHDESSRFVCLQFGRSAEYAIIRGSGREISLEEAIEISNYVEDVGLVHNWRNNTSLTGVNVSCNCCRDCCMDRVPVDMTGLPLGKVLEKSRYVAIINQEECKGCKVCLNRCQFDAIEMVPISGSKKLKAKVNSDKCYGCGVCVVRCKEGAIKMQVVRPPEHIPEPPA